MVKVGSNFKVKSWLHMINPSSFDRPIDEACGWTKMGWSKRDITYEGMA